MKVVDPMKVAFVLDYLHRGGELRIGATSFVWLLNEKVGESETHEYFIDGLARKLTKTDLSTGEESPHYMGCKDMNLTYFFELLEEIDPMEYADMLFKLQRMREGLS
ncbi:hypothetical protein Thu_191 [Bacillus phage Thurquoise]|uniref:Uncharacterized protein n=1 Tax=Bacillus phage Deep Blue TaxID=1792245 RepID=A0A140HLQ7_9CAUD|nr:hypothetical protein Blue_096 [Bacillus phage Deep Blue]AMO25919.1 hypothetical protein Blue_096 [Bacillus phage Deep Blue]UXQ89034.1 hypothetical protein Thu_191 [Bacillus phage Thurquoise]